MFSDCSRKFLWNSKSISSPSKGGEGIVCPDHFIQNQDHSQRWNSASFIIHLAINFLFILNSYYTYKHRLLSHLGSGQFGSVDKGVWRCGSDMKEVAVKTLTDPINTVQFLQEAAIMAQFTHPNVLTLHGVVSKGDPVRSLLQMTIYHIQNGE